MFVENNKTNTKKINTNSFIIRILLLITSAAWLFDIDMFLIISDGLVFSKNEYGLSK